ncbi:hypothetical protein [Streptomyces abikoensis]|uniref:hypothetical protein n=1 Tax=Streptomyces abikoensis TaxID=97398 RepID=UPI00167A036F|nr:hypothetical protein [Streptomyces abikoensis]GGP40528.1 hypothetical protein GCM10010214_12380 [Streptomyces abikoensis]
MPLILDQLREWQDEGGPAAWQASWERTIELVGPLWEGRGTNVDGVLLAEGAAALTIALYVIAKTEGISPAQVTRAQVEELRGDPGSRFSKGGEEWERRLRAAGHDPDDSDDPVAIQWQRLRVDHRPPDGAPDEVWADTFTRWGPGFIQGLDRALAPMWSLSF